MGSIKLGTGQVISAMLSRGTREGGWVYVCATSCGSSSHVEGFGIMTPTWMIHILPRSGFLLVKIWRDV
jgi:hypothetical protein